MELVHHVLDVNPVPKEASPLYINEPWLIDESLFVSEFRTEDMAEQDNVRIYAPLDISKAAILRRLDFIVAQCGMVTEANEFSVASAVDMLVSQIEIYDKIWYVRNIPKDRSKHSGEAVELVKEFVARLESIPDGGAELFPFQLIEDLKVEFC